MSGTEGLSLAVALPPETLDAIVERAAELVSERTVPSRRYMSRGQAAVYLGVSEAWLEKRTQQVPFSKAPDSNRVFYDRVALDRLMEVWKEEA